MIAFIILLLINLYILFTTRKISTYSENEKWTIFGTMGCGWTRKQLEYMKKNGKQFTFVDCDSDDCGDLDGFPTIVHPDGKQTTGYREL